MRRLAIFIIAVLTMATVNAKILTERQKGLAACACLMAQGDLEQLEPAVRTALSNGRNALAKIQDIFETTKCFREKCIKKKKSAGFIY